MNKKFDELLTKISEEFHSKVENMTVEQLKDALYGAVMSGDFEMHVQPVVQRFPSAINDRHVVIEQKQGVSYVPYREKLKLESKINKMKEWIEDIGHNWNCNRITENPNGDFKDYDKTKECTCGYCDVMDEN